VQPFGGFIQVFGWQEEGKTRQTSVRLSDAPASNHAHPELNSRALLLQQLSPAGSKQIGKFALAVTSDFTFVLWA
jgi:hypothetical protein